jgi:hypothetical protein
MATLCALRVTTAGSFVLALLLPTAIPGQCLTRPESVTVVSGRHYDANWLHARILGENYRTVWTTPIRVPILDLCSFAGGLTVIPRADTALSGGKQTLSIRLRGANGREYVFRSVDKDPTLVLPEPLRRTVVRHIVRDMTSIGHPVGALVVAPMLRASGVLHAEPTLVVLPDDPRLGSYRERFKGMLGMIEERPNDEDEGGTSLPGVTDVISTQSLFTRLDRSPNDRVDARAFLAARLVDLFLGDWDRHQDQWRWGRAAKGTPWLPIPRDRDMAFAKSEGILMPLARVRYPQFVDFSNEYPSMVGLAWQARVLDRRLLSSLERSAWDSVVADLRSRLSDAVIDEAVGRLPKEYQAIHGTWLAATLRARRDLLPSAADRLYKQLAAEADVHASDAADEAEVRVLEDGDIELTIRPRSANGAGEPHFRRRFDRADTREVRLYHRGGDDRLVVRGERKSDIVVRVEGGAGADEFIDETPGCASNVHIYDADAATATAGCARIDRRPYVATGPRDNTGPLRDWGTKLEPAPWLGFSPDVGAVLGGGVTHYRYGFRHKPFVSRQTIRAAFTTGAQRFKGEYDAEFHPRNSGLRYDLFARASGIEIIRFHGFGNETPAAEPREHYEVEQEQYIFEPGVSFPLAARATFALGPTLKHARTHLDASPFLATLGPYGAERFSQVGARAGLTVDTRDRLGYPERGVLIKLRGVVYPEVWDVTSTFGATEGEASAYMRLGGPVLALRAGGKQTFGTYPFHEAAFIGGASTLRGWTEQRFAGDASVYWNAELRVYLSEVFIVLPGEIGVFALADGGRVFLDGESSDSWHSALGGGLWLAFLDRANTISIAYARGKERGGLYISLGFTF